MSHLQNFISILNTAAKQRSIVAKVKNTRLIRLCIKKLVTLGYLQGFVLDKNNDKLLVYLKVTPILNRTILRSIKAVSKPGKRVYTSYKVFNEKKLSNFNTSQIVILTTPKGLLSHKEAFLQKTGGEILFMVT